MVDHQSSLILVSSPTGWDEFDVPPPKHTRRHFFKPKLTFIEFLVLVSIVGVLLGLLLPAGDWDRKHRFPPALQVPRNDLANVAGSYDQGARLGRSWSLEILPDGRYSFIWSGCTGVHCRESGYAREISGYLLLTPSRPIEPSLPRVFFPVRWGPRDYLIPPEKFQEFCDEIIEGSEPRYERPRHFYSSDRALGIVEGVPELPQRWAIYLDENLLMGAVVEVLEGGRAKINLGTMDGVRVGDPLTVRGPVRSGPRPLEVLSVEQHFCIARDEFPDEFDEKLQKGKKVVTRRVTTR